MHFFTGGSGLWIHGQLLSSPDVNWWTGVVWIIVMFLSAVWTLILTAPIHCRASIAETLMQRHISTNLMKKQTHPNLGWSEDISIFGWTVPLNRLRSSCTHLHPPRLQKKKKWTFFFSVDYYKTLSCQHLYDFLFSADHKSRYKVVFSLQKMHHNSHPWFTHCISGSEISRILNLAAHWSVKLMLFDFKPAEMTGLSVHEHKWHVRAILGRFSVCNDIRVNMMFCWFK